MEAKNGLIIANQKCTSENNSFIKEFILEPFLSGLLVVVIIGAMYVALSECAYLYHQCVILRLIILALGILVLIWLMGILFTPSGKCLY